MLGLSFTPDDTSLLSAFICTVRLLIIPLLFVERRVREDFHQTRVALKVASFGSRLQVCDFRNFRDFLRGLNDGSSSFRAARGSDCGVIFVGFDGFLGLRLRLVLIILSQATGRNVAHLRLQHVAHLTDHHIRCGLSFIALLSLNLRLLHKMLRIFPLWLIQLVRFFWDLPLSHTLF